MTYRFGAVVVFHEGRLVLTLNADGLPASFGAGRLRVGGVGGGCEDGETFEDCARREAEEELSVPVTLVSAIAVEPPGTVFLGRLQGEPEPGDVEALLLLPLDAWQLLETEPTVAAVHDAGARIIVRTPLAPDTRLWLHPAEGLRAIVPRLTEEVLATFA
jgi:8-oxo-dGTP pyrophosphatase MutT (NUDIX family)